MSDEKLEALAMAYAKVEKEPDGCYSADSLEMLELARSKISAFKAGYLAGLKAERGKSQWLIDAIIEIGADNYASCECGTIARDSLKEYERVIE